jgi:hypothetical protein
VLAQLGVGLGEADDRRVGACQRLRDEITRVQVSGADDSEM